MKSSLNKIKTLTFSDPAGKLIAVILGVFLWYYVNVVSIEKLYISLPVRLVNVPDDIEVIPAGDLVVQVEISTHEDVSRRIGDLDAVIDMDEYKPGINKYDVIMRNLPHDINAKLSAKTKTLQVYEIISKTVPINFRADSHPLLTNTSYEPKEASIYASERILKDIHSLDTTIFSYGEPAQPSLTTNVQIIEIVLIASFLS